MTLPISQTADAALQVERAGQRLSGILQRRDVREQPAGVDEDSVAAEWATTTGTPAAFERLAEVRRRRDAVAQVVLVDDLAQS